MSCSAVVLKAQIFSSCGLSCYYSLQRLLGSYFRNILLAATWLVFLSNQWFEGRSWGRSWGLNLLSSGRTDTPSPYSQWEVKSSKKLNPARVPKGTGHPSGQR